MLKFTTAALVAATLALAAPALAQNAVDSEMSMQQALFVARNIGVIGIKQVEFYDGKWQVEGRDPTGQNIEVEVDAATGTVVNVDRWW